MVSRFLVTTAIQSTWKNSEKILFLGEWCKLHKNKHDWEKLDYVTQDYHWNNREILYKDYQYLQSLYKKVISACANSLNQFHEVNYSERYWKIFIGPWLFHFTEILFDRWQMIGSIEKDKISETIILTGLDEMILPVNFSNFSELYSKDLWNHWIYGEIIKHLGKFSIIEVPYNQNNKKIHCIQKQNGIKQFIKKILKIYSYFNKKNKYFFYGSSFNKLNQFQLEVLLKQLPSFYDYTKNDEINISKTKNRSLFDINFDQSNEFEVFLSKMIPSQMPQYYLEGFANLHQQGQRNYWPTDPKTIITSSAIINTDIFKFWVAEKTENGSKLIIVQHGGHYGTGKWSSGEDHEIDISDIFASWGWSGKGVYPLSAAKLIASKNVSQSNNKSKILIALGLTQRYSYWLYSIPVATQWLGYFEDQIRFLEILPNHIKEKINVRLSPADYGWCHKERLLEKLPLLQFDDPKVPFLSSLANSKIFIGTYNATTFLETFSANIPTIVFWNPSHSEIRESSIPYFNIIHDAGIMHYSAESAANHLIKIWSDIDEWWQDKETQNARVKFLNQYAKTSSDWKNEWKNFIIDL